MSGIDSIVCDLNELIILFDFFMSKSFKGNFKFTYFHLM